jgi:hypothetical protein
MRRTIKPIKLNKLNKGKKPNATIELSDIIWCLSYDDLEEGVCVSDKDYLPTNISVDVYLEDTSDKYVSEKLDEVINLISDQYEYLIESYTYTYSLKKKGKTK